MKRAEMCSSKPVWAKYLVQSGLYYEGTVTECELEKVLELHKRDTVTTFGTRSSRRVVLPKKGSRVRQTDENTGYTANVVTESGNGEKKKTQQVRVSLTIICYIFCTCDDTTLEVVILESYYFLLYI